MDKPNRHISLGHVQIGDLEKQFVNEVLDSNRLSAGKYIHGFETEVAALHGCRYGIMCNSGASALSIAIAALKERGEWNEDDEVIVPALTYISVPNAIMQCGLQPVFVDVDPAYYTINPHGIKAKITRRTRAIIPAHLFGFPCLMGDIKSLAVEHNLSLIEDASQAMFAQYQQSPVGSFGDIACFSTDAGQPLTTGVGGVITTNDQAIAVICRSLQSQGRDPIYLTIDDDDDLQDEARRRRIVERRFSYVRLGHSYRVTELEGALGLAQLADRDTMLRQRRANAHWLNQKLSRFSECLQLPDTPPNCAPSWSFYPIVAKNGLDRAPVVDYLEAHGIETRFMLPLLNQPIYKKIFGNIENRFPVARGLSQNGFYIGCHQGLTREDLAYIVRRFEAFFAEYEKPPDDAA
ncbi:MAG: DegT/DnrJ/EryC1/StrS family aminotransferase [Acidobacteria bacterium]|nr:DegT/DnrJ/EryC1/StrS family aminotransferase [Acidobacteriota bacterium]MBI3656688.1 DegT/DnrJ/EryC1/StrS family aminotransferase [Acidobacteriota bacterium]